MSRGTAALLALSIGCASSPRPMPTTDWARDRDLAVFVDMSPGIRADARNMLRSGIEEDLRAAGWRILVKAVNRGELHLGTSDFTGRVVTVTLDRDGEVIQTYTLAFTDLACFTNSSEEEADRCIAREIAARVMESDPVFQAMHARAAPTAAPPPVAVVPKPPRTLAGKLAVLELHNFTSDLTAQNAQYFTDVVRSAALKAQPQLDVMTRENLLVLLQASGKDLANCEGECEVDTGRRIGADEIVSGEIQKLGTLYKISLRLHDTREGRLLASTQASGKTIEELDADAQRAAQELLR